MGSARGRDVLSQWATVLPKFVKIMPRDYKRVLQAIDKAKKAGLTGEEAINAAFEANARDISRLGGG